MQKPSRVVLVGNHKICVEKTSLGLCRSQEIKLSPNWTLKADAIAVVCMRNPQTSLKGLKEWLERPKESLSGWGLHPSKVSVLPEARRR